MEISAIQLILVFLVSCLVGMGSVLDEFQTHRPLVACTLIGLVLGDLNSGIMVGGTLEIIAVGWMNIGAAIAPDAALASVISTILVVAGKQPIDTAIGLAIPLAAAGQVLTIIVRAITVGVQHAADNAVKTGNLSTITWLHLGALIMQAMRIAIPAVIVASTVGSESVQNMLNAIPDVVTGGLKVAGGIIVVVGYAMVINMMRAPHLMMFFFVGFVVAAFTNFNLVALGILGMAMAYFYIQMHQNQKIQLTKSDLNACFIRSNLLQGSWNFERMQALGYCFGIVPAIRRLYPEGSQERKDAIKRHLEFYNTQPFVTAPILGVNLAMEEQRANGAPIDDAAINGVKVGLMGPLAGVGDPIFWGTLRPICAVLGANIALVHDASGQVVAGNILGPILFFLMFNIVRLFFRYWGIQYGYKKGLEIVSDMSGGILQKITEAASILGLFVMGALVVKWTNINITLSLPAAEGATPITVQSILDSLLPGLPALGMTFLCMYLLRKGVNALWLIFGIFGIGILGYWLKILA